MTTYFVTGHLDLTDEEFAAHYAPRMRDAIAAGASFVVGTRADAIGWRRRSCSRGCPRVRVFHMLEAPRHNAGFPTNGGFRSDRDRDEALTDAYDEDLAWVRPGRESSGTARNLARRGMVKP